MAGIDNISKNYLDEGAPVIDQPNVPDRGDNHRQVIQDYTKEKMTVFYAQHESADRTSGGPG